MLLFKRANDNVLKSCIRSYSTKEKKTIQTLNNNNNSKKTTSPRAPEIPSFMPVINIPVTELAHNAFYSLHRPLLGLSIPEPFIVGNIVGQIDKENNTTSEEDLLQYMSKLRPFEPPELKPNDTIQDDTTTITVQVDPSYFLNHNNNHDEITDYLTAMQEKLDLLYDERERKATLPIVKKKMRRQRKRKGFFEKN